MLMLIHPTKTLLRGGGGLGKLNIDLPLQNNASTVCQVSQALLVSITAKTL